MRASSNRSSTSWEEHPNLIAEGGEILVRLLGPSSSATGMTLAIVKDLVSQA
jgi:hypothetical protein